MRHSTANIRRLTRWTFSPTRYLAVVNVLSHALSLAQGVIVARLLAPEAYGVIAVIAGMNVAVLNFLDVRLADLAGKLYYSISSEHTAEARAYRASVLQICLIGNGLISLALCVLGLLANLAFIQLFTSTPVRTEWLLAQALILALANWNNTFNYLQRFSGRFYLMGTWRLATAILAVSLFLTLFLALPNLDGYYRALLFSTTLSLSLGLALSAFIWTQYDHLPLLRRGLLRAWRDYRREFRFLFFGNLLGYTKMLHRGTDVLLVGLFADDRITGLYKLARALTDSLYLLFDALNQVYYPRLMELLTRGAIAEYRRLLRRLLSGATLFTAMILVFEAITLPFLLPFVLTHRFAGAEGAIMVLTVPFFFVAGVHTWLWPIFVHSGKLGAYTTFNYIACLAQYALTIALFRMFGQAPLYPAWGYLVYYLVLMPLAGLLAWKWHPRIVTV